MPKTTWRKKYTSLSLAKFTEEVLVWISVERNHKVFFSCFTKEVFFYNIGKLRFNILQNKVKEITKLLVVYNISSISFFCVEDKISTCFTVLLYLHAKDILQQN